MRILVTGATGFIGRHAVRALSAAGHEIVSTSRSPSGPPGAARHVPHDIAAAPVPVDGRVDAIVHLAGDGNAQASWQSTGEVARLNAQGTLNALQVAARSGSIFVLASTQRVYRPSAGALRENAPTVPLDPYGYTKLAAELYVEMAGRLFGVPGAILRFFTVYGPGQRIESGVSGVVAILGQRAIRGEPLPVMSHQRKDFVDVSDAVTAIQLAIAKPTTPSRAYNIATGVPTTVYELASAIRAATGSGSAIVEDYREGAPGDLVADISRARRELGFEPRVDLRQGLKRYVDWLRTGAHPA